MWLTWQAGYFTGFCGVCQGENCACSAREGRINSRWAVSSRQRLNWPDAMAGYVLYHGCKEIGGAIRILMGAAPNEGDLAKAVSVIQSVDGVRSDHHIHPWTMDEHALSLEAHVVVDVKDFPSAEVVKKEIEASLHDQVDTE